MAGIIIIMSSLLPFKGIKESRRVRRKKDEKRKDRKRGTRKLWNQINVSQEEN